MTQRRAAVLGSPISHSLSPVLHRSAYAALGLDWIYEAIEVDERSLAAFIASCGPEWAGLSLTMPLKTAVLPLLDEVSETARVSGAANTVTFTPSGLRGDNTDVPGMISALASVGGIGHPVSTGTIIGGGATARSALLALARMGVTRVHVVLRDVSRCAELEALAETLDLELDVHGWIEGTRHLDADVVISTVPDGATDAFARAVPPVPGALLDVAYSSGDTDLVREWRARGGVAADGLDLLLWQAVDQVRLMTGLDAPAAEMRDALRSVAPWT